jgi:hypothetical protein
MNQFRVDLNQLSNKISKRAYKLADVKDQIEKVSFDIVRFKDSDQSANLWQIHSADDGDYIVAMYEDDPEEKVASSWQVKMVKNSELQISYKGDPLVSLSAKKIGIPVNELYQAEAYLPEKLASNKKLVKTLLQELPHVARQEVARRYPELIEGQ